jgi:hypothetical protein
MALNDSQSTVDPEDLYLFLAAFFNFSVLIMLRSKHAGQLLALDLFNGTY